MAIHAFEYEFDTAPDDKVIDSAEAVAKDEDSNSTTTAISGPAQERNLLLNFPAEIINQIYANCKSLQVDIARDNQKLIFLGGFEGLLEGVHSQVTKEFAYVYYTENMFFLDIRQNFELHGRTDLDNIWKPWLETLKEQYVGMIQHFRILTPAFSAVVHIPTDRNNDVAVTFRPYMYSGSSNGRGRVNDMIVEFQKKLERFNATVKGQRLDKDDLDLLIKVVISTVPYCCRHGQCDQMFCPTRPDSGKPPGECACRSCSRRATDGPRDSTIRRR